MGEEGVDGGVWCAEDGEGLGGGVAEVEAAEVHVEGPDEVGVGGKGDGFARDGEGLLGMVRVWSPGSLMVTWKLSRAGMG